MQADRGFRVSQPWGTRRGAAGRAMGSGGLVFLSMKWVLASPLTSQKERSGEPVAGPGADPADALCTAGTGQEILQASGPQTCSGFRARGRGRRGSQSREALSWRMYRNSVPCPGGLPRENGFPAIHQPRGTSQVQQQDLPGKRTWPAAEAVHPGSGANAPCPPNLKGTDTSYGSKSYGQPPWPWLGDLSYGPLLSGLDFLLTKPE